jgi:predicted dehydrogenase
MKALLAGMGAHGAGWFRRMRAKGLQIVVVDKNEALREAVTADGAIFYSELAEAIERERPDFVVNVTPPHVHGAVNHLAFDHKLPVLCEKPISFDYEEAANMTERAVRERIPFMIAENYRRLPYPRTLKRLLTEGAVGRISTIDVAFCRYHHVQRGYAVSLLDDIAVHHFDMMRYFTGAEGRRIFASRYQPLNAWPEEGADHNLTAFAEMENGVRITYSGTITSRFAPTVWHGNWRIDGTEGAAELTEKRIVLYRDGKRTEVELADEPADVLDDFLAALQSGVEPETSAADYMRTQAFVHAAKLSGVEERMISVLPPHYSNAGGAWRREGGR